MEDGHIKTVDEVLNYFNTDPERGLTPDQVRKNQEKYGPNGKCHSLLNPKYMYRTKKALPFFQNHYIYMLITQRQPCKITLRLI